MCWKQHQYSVISELMSSLNLLEKRGQCISDFLKSGMFSRVVLIVTCIGWINLAEISSPGFNINNPEKSLDGWNPLHVVVFKAIRLSSVTKTLTYFSKLIHLVWLFGSITDVLKYWNLQFSQMFMFSFQWYILYKGKITKMDVHEYIRALRAYVADQVSFLQMIMYRGH